MGVVLAPMAPRVRPQPRVYTSERGLAGGVNDAVVARPFGGDLEVSSIVFFGFWGKKQVSLPKKFRDLSGLYHSGGRIY